MRRKTALVGVVFSYETRIAMKRLTTTALLALAGTLLATAAAGQVYLVNENFTAPAGWTATVQGTAPTNWALSSGGQPASGPLNQTPVLNGQHYIANADATGSAATLSRCTLTSPVFNGTTAPGTLTLTFNEVFVWIGGADQGQAQIFDGTTWQTIHTVMVASGASGNPAPISIDITAHKHANNQLRFIYDDAMQWGWWWAIDDVQVSYLSGPEIDVTISAVPVPTGSTQYLGLRPAGQSFNQVIIVGNPGNAALTHTATITPTPVNCTVNITSALAASTTAGGQSNMIIEVTPTGFGAFSAQVSIANNDTTGSENPYLINFSGMCLGNTQRFYAGDNDGTGGIVSGQGFSIPIDSWIWERFTVPAGETWTITHLYANYIGSDISGVTQVDYEVRTGMALGVGGTVAQSGTVAGTATRTSITFSFTGFPPMFEFTTHATLAPTFQLTAGTYYLGVRPRTTAVTAPSYSFCATTSGANGIAAVSTDLSDQFAMWHDNNGQFAATPYEQADLDGQGFYTDHSIGLSGSVSTGGSAVIDIATSTLPNAVELVAYSTAISATQNGTTGPYTWGLTGAPAWLSIAGTGLTATLSGTPPAGAAAASPHNFTITVTAASSETDSQPVSLTVLPAGTLIITTTTLVNGTVGNSFNRTINSSGGTGPYSWTLAAGTLPTGVTLQASTTGSVQLTGIPTTANTFNFTIQVTDSTAGTPQNDTQVFSVIITAGGGPIGGGGGGGGGGCAAEAGTPWAALLGLLALAGFAIYRRRRVA